MPQVGQGGEGEHHDNPAGREFHPQIGETKEQGLGSAVETLAGSLSRFLGLGKVNVREARAFVVGMCVVFVVDHGALFVNWRSACFRTRYSGVEDRD